MKNDVASQFYRAIGRSRGARALAVWAVWAEMSFFMT